MKLKLKLKQTTTKSHSKTVCVNTHEETVCVNTHEDRQRQRTTNKNERMALNYLSQTSVPVRESRKEIVTLVCIFALAQQVNPCF